MSYTTTLVPLTRRVDLTREDEDDVVLEFVSLQYSTGEPTVAELEQLTSLVQIIMDLKTPAERLHHMQNPSELSVKFASYIHDEPDSVICTGNSRIATFEMQYQRIMQERFGSGILFDKRDAFAYMQLSDSECMTIKESNRTKSLMGANVPGTENIHRFRQIIDDLRFNTMRGIQQMYSLLRVVSNAASALDRGDFLLFVLRCFRTQLLHDIHCNVDYWDYVRELNSSQPLTPKRLFELYSRCCKWFDVDGVLTPTSEQTSYYNMPWMVISSQVHMHLSILMISNVAGFDLLAADYNDNAMSLVTQNIFVNLNAVIERVHSWYMSSDYEGIITVCIAFYRHIMDSFVFMSDNTRQSLARVTERSDYNALKEQVAVLECVYANFNYDMLKKGTVTVVGLSSDSVPYLRRVILMVLVIMRHDLAKIEAMRVTGMLENLQLGQPRPEYILAVSPKEMFYKHYIPIFTMNARLISGMSVDVANGKESTYIHRTERASKLNSEQLREFLQPLFKLLQAAHDELTDFSFCRLMSKVFANFWISSRQISTKHRNKYPVFVWDFVRKQFESCVSDAAVREVVSYVASFFSPTVVELRQRIYEEEFRLVRLEEERLIYNYIYELLMSRLVPVPQPVLAWQ